MSKLLSCGQSSEQVQGLSAFVNGIQARVTPPHAFRRGWPVVTLFSGCTLP
ncbi:MAG: hypothetical protein VXZ82_11275 [Planctomycetota bacterium]|nr:hypothetical protein [Planctomycetota bacterium]